MTTSEIRSALRRRWPATLGVLVLAITIAVVVHGQLSTVPTGTATAQILVDSPNSALVNVNVNSAGLTSQASVLAQAMTSQAVLQHIAVAAGVPPGSVSAQGPFNGAGEVLDIPTPSEARANQIVSIKSSYHVAFVAQPTVPIITVTVLGPNPFAAGHLADSVLPGVEAYLSSIALTSPLSTAHRVVLRQLGDAQAGEVNSRTSEEVAIVAAIASILLGLLGVTLVDRGLRNRDELRRRADRLADLQKVSERGTPDSEELPAAPFDQTTRPRGGRAEAPDAEAPTTEREHRDGELATAGAAAAGRSDARQPVSKRQRIRR